jgi:small-conductance mechanosensitive channel
MKFIPLAALVAALLAVNYLLRMVLAGVSARNIVLSYINRYLPLLELIVWTSFTVWILNILFTDSRYLLYLNTLIFLFAFIFLSWYVLRDYFVGVQIKTRFNLIDGQRLHANDVKGEIQHMGLMSMRIRSENGKNIIIPYSQLNQETIEFDFHQKGQSAIRFIFEIDSPASNADVIEKITEMVMNSLWCSHKNKPQVLLISEQEGKKKYEITCLPNGKDGGEKIKFMLTQLYKNSQTYSP